MLVVGVAVVAVVDKVPGVPVEELLADKGTVVAGIRASGSSGGGGEAVS